MEWPSITIKGSRDYIDSSLKEYISDNDWLVSRKRLANVEEPYWLFVRMTAQRNYVACFFLHQPDGLKLANCMIWDRHSTLDDEVKKMEDRQELEMLMNDVLSNIFPIEKILCNWK